PGGGPKFVSHAYRTDRAPPRWHRNDYTRIELLLPAMAPVRREAPHPWKVTPRWAGERPADPGQDPSGNSPPATAPPSPVLGSSHRRAAVAVARCQPRHP